MHPDYRAKDLINDIAIIRLSTHATINNFVRPICLWQNKLDLSEVIDKSGTVIGWGHTETGKISNELRETSMPVIKFGKCLKADPYFFANHLKEDTTFCAGFGNGSLHEENHEETHIHFYVRFS